MDELKTIAAMRLIPLKGGISGKQPRDKGFATNDYTFDEIEQNVKNGGNVGMMIEPGMVDVDLDWPEMRTLVTASSFDTMA